MNRRLKAVVTALLEKRNLHLLLKLTLVFILTLVTCLAIYQYDNKYTASGPKAQNGVLMLSQESLSENPLLFLVDGWEYYSDCLLTPADFIKHPPRPDQYMFIGQFGGFEKWNKDNAPHGSASYRLNIQIPRKPARYMLELPEIFSAYRLYINGIEVAQMGTPEPVHYRPETGNRSVVVEAGDNLEILFAVSDFSHLYSGMVYPPAFGQPAAVSSLLNTRLIFRSLLSAAALTIGLLSVWVGLLIKNNHRTLLFGLLCLFFVGYTGYPLTKTIFTGFQPQYIIENLSFCVMLCLVMLLTKQICRLTDKWSWLFISCGPLICGLTILLHLFLPHSSLAIMLAYSGLISTYEWITAAFITITVLLTARKNTAKVTPLLYGIIIFDCTLILDRLLPLYEPIRFGWFIELASFVIILLMGVLIGQEVGDQYRERAVLSERAKGMERLYKSQLSHFHTLKQEIAQTKTLRHDMRHHLTVIDSYVKNQQYEKLGKYVQEYHDSASMGEIPDYCPIDVINVLTHHYAIIAQQNHIHLELRCDLAAAADPGHSGMSDSDLCCIYSNLIENAIEACMRIPNGPKTIRAAVFRTSSNTLHIRVWNTADNVRRIGSRFITSKGNGQTGYGLSSITAIAEKYGGSASFHWDLDKKEFESNVVVEA